MFVHPDGASTRTPAARAWTCRNLVNASRIRTLPRPAITCNFSSLSSVQDLTDHHPAP